MVGLPMYTFGDTHPVERTQFVVRWEDEPASPVQSGLYGSFADPWSTGQDLKVGGMSAMYEGDGASFSFNIPSPQRIQLHQWNEESPPLGYMVAT